QLTTLVIADIARRATEQTRNGMWLHILRHVEADQVVLSTKQFGGNCLCQFSLTNTGWTKEQEGTYRTPWIFQTRARATDRTSNGADGFVLTDDALTQVTLQVAQVLAL